MKKTVFDGVVHKTPNDLHKALLADSRALIKWQGLTPLARNEWICWVEFVKKEETRIDHVRRTVSELKDGMRRPCCWIGCPHRKDKAISSSVRWFLEKRRKKALPE